MTCTREPVDNLSDLIIAAKKCNCARCKLGVLRRFDDHPAQSVPVDGESPGSR